MVQTASARKRLLGFCRLRSRKFCRSDHRVEFLLVDPLFSSDLSSSGIFWTKKAEIEGWGRFPFLVLIFFYEEVTACCCQ